MSLHWANFRYSVYFVCLNHVFSNLFILWKVCKHLLHGGFQYKCGINTETLSVLLKSLKPCASVSPITAVVQDLTISTTAAADILLSMLQPVSSCPGHCWWGKVYAVQCGRCHSPGKHPWYSLMVTRKVFVEEEMSKMSPCKVRVRWR